MENASKALIIAGAILIAILLISVAILVINSTGNLTDRVGSQMDQMAKDTFNGQFTPYEGGNKSANQIRTLKSAVLTSNSSNLDLEPIKINGKDANECDTSKLSNTAKFSVKLEYNNGIVSNIEITDKDGTKI